MHLGLKFLSFNGNFFLVLDRGVSGYNFRYDFLCVKIIFWQFLPLLMIFCGRFYVSEYLQ